MIPTMSFRRQMAQHATREAAVDSETRVLTDKLEELRTKILLPGVLREKAQATKVKCEAVKKETALIQAQISELQKVDRTCATLKEVADLIDHKIRNREAQIVQRKATIEHLVKSTQQTIEAHARSVAHAHGLFYDAVLPPTTTLINADRFVMTQTPKLDYMSALDASRENTVVALLNHRLGLLTAERQITTELHHLQRALLGTLPSLLISKEQELAAINADWKMTKAEMLKVYEGEIRKNRELTHHVRRGTHMKSSGGKVVEITAPGLIYEMPLYSVVDEEEEELNVLRHTYRDMNTTAERLARGMRLRLEEKERTLQLEYIHTRKQEDQYESRQIEAIYLQQQMCEHIAPTSSPPLLAAPTRRAKTPPAVRASPEGLKRLQIKTESFKAKQSTSPVRK